MIKPGDVISYLDMCREEGVNLQRGMNFHLGKYYSVILMSLRKNAPYTDRIEENGKVLIYEGHDMPKTSGVSNPKILDQPMFNPGGTLTQNGLFFEAVMKYKDGLSDFEHVKVYEKIYAGIWTYNGLFKLIDSWLEKADDRKVFKFRLELLDNSTKSMGSSATELDHNRMISASVKLEVWKRDKGKCVICGSKENLHYDHIIPYSKGGSSLVAENIQILCAKHNLSKKDNIE